MTAVIHIGLADYAQTDVQNKQLIIGLSSIAEAGLRKTVDNFGGLAYKFTYKLKGLAVERSILLTQEAGERIQAQLEEKTTWKESKTQQQKKIVINK